MICSICLRLPSVVGFVLFLRGTICCEERFIYISCGCAVAYTDAYSVLFFLQGMAAVITFTPLYGVEDESVSANVCELIVNLVFC